MAGRDRRSIPSFRGLQPASAAASTAARGASAKKNTRCELALRRELWRHGFRYRLHLPDLPGRPDIVFPRHRFVIFCDGDFWHGRDLEHRTAKLTRGHNAAYWTAKVKRNVERDRQNTLALSAAGWNVLRLRETEILRETTKVADRIEALLCTTRSHAHRRAARSASSDSGGR